MKKKRRIQTRILLTLFGLTAGILLAVGLVFNLSVRAYIQNRVSMQLNTVRESASSERSKEPPPHDKNDRGHFDRVTGAMGSAVVLDENGSLVTVFQGDREVADALSDYFSTRGIHTEHRYQTLSLDSGEYAVSVSDDPVKKGCFLVSYVDVTAILAFSARINIVLLIIIVAALLVSILLSRGFARSLARPVQELSDFAHEIGSENFETRDLHFGDMEFEELAGSMNQMANELREARQKQETFFQNVSHELRTPLTSIRGNAEGIVYGLMEPQPAAKVILAESDKLGGMVEDILYLSRRGKVTPQGEAQPLDLREILSLCVSEQRTEADKKGVSFTFDFSEEPVPVSIREQDAQRLFGNLISNAIRYAKTTVALVCRRDEEHILVRIADDGPGISQEDLPHIFERFYKGQGGRHGIGLAIAKSAAAAYQGTLQAHNEEGAVFEVRFPG